MTRTARTSAPRRGDYERLADVLRETRPDDLGGDISLGQLRQWRRVCAYMAEALSVYPNFNKAKFLERIEQCETK